MRLARANWPSCFFLDFAFLSFRRTFSATAISRSIDRGGLARQELLWMRAQKSDHVPEYHQARTSLGAWARSLAIQSAPDSSAASNEVVRARQRMPAPRAA